MAEVWRALTYYDGYYEISDQGRIRSLRSAHGPRPKPTIIKGGLSGAGYRQFIACMDGARESVRFHQAVLTAFRRHRELHEVARHLNGNRLDNRLDNLCWGTDAQNTEDKREHGTIACGESHGMAKLDVEAVKAILLYSSANRRALAAHFEVTPITIDNIRSGRNWSHVKQPWGETDLAPKYRGLNLAEPKRKEWSGTPRRGERNSLSKLTEEQVKAIKFYRNYPSTWMAPVFGCTPENIMAITGGKTWTHVEAPALESELAPEFQCMVFTKPPTKKSKAAARKEKQQEDRARAVKAALAAGEPRREICAKFSVSPAYVSRIAKGKRYAHL